MRDLCLNDGMAASQPKEGKIELTAQRDGLFLVDVERLRAVNSLGEMMIATRPSGFPVKKGDKLAVIGMGNTAMDVARTALHGGVQHVTLYARSGKCAADVKETELAQLEGAELMFGMQIVRIIKDGPVFQKSIMNENGKVTGAEGDEVLHPADFTIIAASQGPKSKLIQTTDGLEGTDRGLLKVDENGMTTVPGVFAAGDVVHGGKTVVEAVAEAKVVASAINAYLMQ